ncbi:hypothetical protein WR25_03359 [Diploscapter pachys]|uniref:Uncharacterized protein n=1 Tax=Diploscapter pachys TaxID=2018661 RepID=A0A2A2L3V3_9BILA|nr:hypothetical protein WR25_03359 [Diploscapter pachys]
MANVALGDLVFGLSTTLAQIRIIPNRWAFAYVSLGIAGKIGGPQIKPIPAARQCSLFCFGLWLIAFAQHILFIESQAPEKRIREYLKENKPQYDLDAFPVSGNHMLEQKLTVITLLSIVLPMFPIYVIVIYFYKKVHKFLTMNNSNMSPGTIKGHRRLIQV